MKTSRLFSIVCALFLYTPMPCSAQSTREKVAEAIKPLYEANLRTMEEYTCNMALLNIEKQNALDMMAGKKPPRERYDSLIAKATDCIGRVGGVLPYDSRAKAYAETGNTKAALADFEKALAEAKKGQTNVVSAGEVYEDRADLYIRIGDKAKAEADLREAIRLNSSGYTAKDKLDNLEQKIAEARKAAILANPQSASDYVVVGTENYNLGKYPAAVVAFGKSIGLTPSAAAYAGRGKAWWAQSQFNTALSDLNKAIELAPKDRDAMMWRGYIYRDLKRWDDAIADYTRAMGGKPTSDQLYARGAAYSGKGQYDAALKDQEAALAAAGDNVFSKVNANTGRGDALRGLGKTAEALAAYENAIKAAGTDYFAKLNLIETYLNRGRLYAGMGKTDLARADFKAILDMAPNSQEAKAEMARLNGSATNVTPSTATKKAEEWAMDGRRAANAQNWDEAVKDFTACIKAAPDSAACYALRGAVYGMKGDLPSARTDFDMAIKRSKNNPAIYFMRGQMYAQLNRKPDAVADFREVLKIVPGNPQALKALEMMGEKP